MQSSTCCVPNCTNSSKSSKDQRVSFFRIPVEPQNRCEEWLHTIRMEDLKSKPPNLIHNYRVCSLHFEDVDFMNASKERFMPNAVPKVNLPQYEIEDSSPKTDCTEESQVQYHHADTLSLLSSEEGQMVMAVDV